MLSETAATARNVADVMHQIYEKLGLDHHTYITTINQTGVRFMN
jgi:homoserine kinase